MAVDCARITGTMCSYEIDEFYGRSLVYFLYMFESIQLKGEIKNGYCSLAAIL